ncbi:hypothetical protein GCM10009534_61810 [Kribbella sandramycini]
MVPSDEQPADAVPEAVPAVPSGEQSVGSVPAGASEARLTGPSRADRVDDVLTGAGPAGAFDEEPAGGVSAGLADADGVVAEGLGDAGAYSALERTEYGYSSGLDAPRPAGRWQTVGDERSAGWQESAGEVRADEGGAVGEVKPEWTDEDETGVVPAVAGEAWSEDEPTGVIAAVFDDERYVEARQEELEAEPQYDEAQHDATGRSADSAQYEEYGGPARDEVAAGSQHAEFAAPPELGPVDEAPAATARPELPADSTALGHAPVATAGGMSIPGLGVMAEAPGVELVPGSLEEAMRAEVERPRPRPGESAAFAALHKWCRARTKVVPSGFTIQVQVLDPGAPSYRFDLEPPEIDDPEFAADKLSGLLGDLWLTEAQGEQGGWLFARIDTAGRTLRIDRWYDQVPDWWDNPVEPRLDVHGLVRRLNARDQQWQPSYLGKLYTTAG